MISSHGLSGYLNDEYWPEMQVKFLEFNTVRSNLYEYE